MSSDECDISEFSDLFDLYEDQELLTYKDTSPSTQETEAPSSPSHNGGSGVRSTGPVDVDQRLGAMRHEGPGDSSVHLTQLHVTAKLTASGNPIEDTVTRVLAATRAAVKNDPECAGWDWDKEESVIRGMCIDLVNKSMRVNGEDLSPCLPDNLYNDWSEVVRAGKRPHIAVVNGKPHIRAYNWGKDEGSPNNGDSGVEVVSGSALRLVSGGDSPDGVETSKLPLTLDEWLSRHLPEPKFILGKWLTTTTRTLVWAPTGLGKTLLCVAIGMAASAGIDYLHWHGGRPARVLYVDGEMSRSLLQERLAEEVKRIGMRPEHFYVLSHEDVDDGRWHPLNTKEGQAFLEEVIKAIGGVDLIIFDNIMSLISGDQKDEEGWRQILPFVRSLTRREIAQIWVHHTGHDENKSYGTKTREWQMNTVIGLEKVEHPETDVSFQLTFHKARERKPSTREDFAVTRVTLINDTWESQSAEGKGRNKVSPLTRKFFEALCDSCTNPANKVHGCPAASIDNWRKECHRRGLIEGTKPDGARALFSRHRLALIAANRIACNDTMAWII